MIYLKSLICAYIVLFIGLFFSRIESGPGYQNWLFALIGMGWPTTILVVFTTSLFDRGDKKQEVLNKRKDPPPADEQVQVPVKPKPPALPIIAVPKPVAPAPRPVIKTPPAAPARVVIDTNTKQASVVQKPAPPGLVNQPKKKDTDFIDDLKDI